MRFPAYAFPRPDYEALQREIRRVQRDVIPIYRGRGRVGQMAADYAERDLARACRAANGDDAVEQRVCADLLVDWRA